jgi:hypothetical protein
MSSNPGATKKNLQQIFVEPLVLDTDMISSMTVLACFVASKQENKSKQMLSQG